jgi:uncharacterized protein
VRDYLWKNAHLVSTVVSGKEEEGAKFRDYFDHHDRHRAVAPRWRCSAAATKACCSSLNADPQFDEPPKESHGEQLLSTTSACA